MSQTLRIPQVLVRRHVLVCCSVFMCSVQVSYHHCYVRVSCQWLVSDSNESYLTQMSHLSRGWVTSHDSSDESHELHVYETRASVYIELYFATHGNPPQNTATHSNTMQHTATLRKTLQHIATLCNILQPTATHCNTLQHYATHCNSMQHTATHCNTLQHTATHCNTLQHTATHWDTLQHTATHCDTFATHCNILQPTAKNCNKLQHRWCSTLWHRYQ